MAHEWWDADTLLHNLADYRGAVAAIQRDRMTAKHDLQAAYAKLSAARDISLRKVEVEKAADALTRRKREAEPVIGEKQSAIERARHNLASCEAAIKTQQAFKAQCEADATKPFKCSKGFGWHECEVHQNEKDAYVLANKRRAEDAGRAGTQIDELTRRCREVTADIDTLTREYSIAVGNRDHAAQRLAALPRQMEEYATGRRAEATRLHTAAEEGKRDWLEHRRMERLRDQLGEPSMNREAFILVMKKMATGGTAPLLAPPPTERTTAPPPTDPYRSQMAPATDPYHRATAPPPSDPYLKR